jgi:hypothetical protein
MTRLEGGTTLVVNAYASLGYNNDKTNFFKNVMNIT